MSAKNYTKIKSYNDAMEYLGGKSERPLAHNTRIELDSGCFKIKYHGNTIAELHPEKIVLSSCGWMTLTTKERLNWFIPDEYYIYQEKGVWYVRNYVKDETMTFQDGITFHTDTTVSGYGDSSEKDRIKATTKQIKKYVDGFIKALVKGEVESPNGGDCWYCLMRGEDGVSLGEKTHNQDHILDHMTESCYVPSLLYNAIEAFGVSIYVKSLIGQLWNDSGYTMSTWEEGIFSDQVKSSLTRYIKRQLGIAA